MNLPYVSDFIEEPGPLEAVEGHVLGRHVRLVFRCWVVVFGLVGAQMGWVLRPFIGDPDIPASFLRPQAWDNAYVKLWQLVRGIF